MGQCSKCKKSCSELDLNWITLPSEHHIQISWTGRGRDEVKEQKMELICNECLEKEKSTSSPSCSSSSDDYDD